MQRSQPFQLCFRFPFRPVRFLGNIPVIRFVGFPFAASYVFRSFKPLTRRVPRGHPLNNISVIRFCGLPFATFYVFRSFKPLARRVPRGHPLVGLSGLEPPTSRLSGVRSNRLSYKPSLSGSAVNRPQSFLLQPVDSSSIAFPSI